MSVPKSKRERSELEVITKSNELVSHTIHICSNEKCFPKRYRWCITAKIVETAIDINQNIVMANSIYVGKDISSWKLRKHYQTLGLAAIYSMLSLMDIAYQTFAIDGKKMDYWTGLVIHVQSLLRNWKKADEKRYCSLGDSCTFHPYRGNANNVRVFNPSGSMNNNNANNSNVAAPDCEIYR